MTARLLIPVAALAWACSATSTPTASGTTSPSGTTTTGTTTGTTSGTAPAWYAAFGNGTTVTVSGNFVVITSNGLPDHKSPYYGTTSPQYEKYNGSNPSFQLNPNSIRAQTLTFRMPITPTKLGTPSPTPLGPIGVAINGVPIFNQYAGPNQPLTGEINSFDQYNGHPQQTGQYHYHVEPTWLTRTSREALVGVLLDGYPVYGPMENGVFVSSSALDAAHGHTAVTREFPQGIYHYHTTGDAPYINDSGFAGTPGTVSQ